MDGRKEGKKEERKEFFFFRQSIRNTKLRQRDFDILIVQVRDLGTYPKLQVGLHMNELYPQHWKIAELGVWKYRYSKYGTQLGKFK